LEGRRLLFAQHGGEAVPFQTIVRYHCPARFGLQLVLLDSDVRLDILFPDHASVAPRNFGRFDLEHVARNARQAHRFGGRRCTRQHSDAI
jgi:hypothetical protein